MEKAQNKDFALKGKAQEHAQWKVILPFWGQV